MCDRDIFKFKIKLPSPLQQIRTDPGRNLVDHQSNAAKSAAGNIYHFTLCNQLSRVELRDDALQHLIAN